MHGDLNLTPEEEEEKVALRKAHRNERIRKWRHKNEEKEKAYSAERRADWKTDEVFKCEPCGLVLSSRQVYTSHINSFVHKEKSRELGQAITQTTHHDCDDCQLSFGTKKEVVNHLKTKVHANCIDPKPSPVRPFCVYDLCEVCNHWMVRGSAARVHEEGRDHLRLLEARGFWEAAHP